MLGHICGVLTFTPYENWRRSHGIHHNTVSDLDRRGRGDVWLFYIQHQFEGVYWARHPVWDPMKAALEGSSFYQLPSMLQWFSGNIGFHHIHHVRPRIPNYHLERCHAVMAPWQAITTLTLRDSLRSLKLKLWDEKQNRLVGFDAVKG